MSIQAKKESILRVGGMSLIFFSLVFSIILTFYNISNFFLYVGLLTIILPYFSFTLCLKLEISVIVENKVKIVIILAALSIFLFNLFLMLCNTSSELPMFIFLIILDLLLLVCWQFSLSIYKKEKMLYGIGGIGTVFFYSIVCIFSYFSQAFWYLNLIVLLLFSIGFLSILISERILIKKSLLKYI
jgi:hypothetical protein